MPSLTIHLEPQIFRQSHSYATSHGMSLSQLINKYLEELSHTVETTPPANEQQLVILSRYSQDELSRKETMTLLNLEYGELIVVMAEHHLPLPSLPEADLQKMVATFVNLWNGEITNETYRVSHS